MDFASIRRELPIGDLEIRKDMADWFYVAFGFPFLPFPRVQRSDPIDSPCAFPVRFSFLNGLFEVVFFLGYAVWVGRKGHHQEHHHFRNLSRISHMIQLCKMNTIPG